MVDDAYRAYRSVVESPALRSIWKEVYGDRFWSDVDPPWTLATLDDVQFVTEHVCHRQAFTLVDLGCGSGALARHLVRNFGAKVEGLDANPSAIHLARERSSDVSVSSNTSFHAGDIGATPFADHSFDGAASLDVLLFVSDKPKVLREVARILRPKAHFAGTTFELGSTSIALAAPAFVDYPSAFAAAGFTIEVYEVSAAWRELLEAVTVRILERESEISREIHPQALTRVLRWARTRPPELAESRRVRFCVRKSS